MSKREEVLNVIDNRDTTKRIFMPLADSFFAASVAGKPWLSEVTLEDELEAARQGGYHHAFVQGSAPDLTVNPALAGLVVTERVSESETERRYTQTITTPVGELSRNLIEQAYGGITATDEFLEDEDEFPIADWITEEILAGNRDEAIRGWYSAFVAARKPHGITQVQVELPYFLYGLPGFASGPLMFAMDEDSGYDELMEKAAAALHRVAGLLVDVGVDCIWFGAGGTELLSPTVWEEIVIPQSKAMVAEVHAKGGRTHFHCCGQSRLWVEKGYFNEIGMDVLETLSAPPSGSIEDLAAARSAIDKNIVTRGNIDLGLLRDGTPEECAAAAKDVLAATAGYPHIVGAGDDILYGTPVENVQAVQAVCAACNS